MTATKTSTKIPTITATIPEDLQQVALSLGNGNRAEGIRIALTRIGEQEANTHAIMMETLRTTLLTLTDPRILGFGKHTSAGRMLTQIQDAVLEQMSDLPPRTNVSSLLIPQEAVDGITTEALNALSEYQGPDSLLQFEHKQPAPITTVTVGTAINQLAILLTATHPECKTPLYELISDLIKANYATASAAKFDDRYTHLASVGFRVAKQQVTIASNHPVLNEIIKAAPAIPDRFFNRNLRTIEGVVERGPTSFINHMSRAVNVPYSTILPIIRGLQVANQDKA